LEELWSHLGEVAPPCGEIVEAFGGIKGVLDLVAREKIGEFQVAVECPVAFTAADPQKL
jgi:hypothetical protein